MVRSALSTQQLRSVQHPEQPISQPPNRPIFQRLQPPEQPKNQPESQPKFQPHDQPEDQTPSQPKEEPIPSRGIKRSEGGKVEHGGVGSLEAEGRDFGSI